MNQVTYSAIEAAGFLGVNERTIRRAIQRGELQATKSGRSFLIDHTDLEAFRTQIRKSGEPTLEQIPASPDVPLTRTATSLVGRERELSDVLEMLRENDARIVTITGPGGVGKTRLGLEIMSRIGDDFRDAPAFTSLTSISSAADVPAAIALASRIQPGTKSIANSVLDVYREREALLVLDNFEHVHEAGIFVQQLLESAPSIVILATSRQPLGLEGERVFELQPLGVPDSTAGSVAELRRATPAVRLFVDRLRRQSPEFMLTAENAGAVAEIVRRLDGLPLGIELVAPLVASQTPDALLERLERQLPLLIGGNRNLPARHQTLRETIDWSYRRLNSGRS